jgi:hypothetical protein
MGEEGKCQYRDSKTGRFAKMPVTSIEEASWYLVCALKEALPKVKKAPYIRGEQVVAYFPATRNWHLVKEPRTPEGAQTVALFGVLQPWDKRACKEALIRSGELV